MTSTSAPFAAGVHLPWAQVPSGVHEWAAGVGGGPPHRAQDLAGGFSPGAIARLEFPGRPDVFCKAVGAELNPESPDMHRREGLVSSELPRSALLPRLIGTYDDGRWVALAFVAVEGRLPHHPWRAAELDAALRALGHMHELLTPTPSAAVAASPDHLRDDFGG